MGKIIAFIILAIALDLVWGFTGLLSLGHAVFFGIGGYILALSYHFQNGVPSFMTRFQITEIPLIMKPLTSLPIALVLGIILPGILAALLGLFMFKGKVNGVYFAIITLALAALFQMLIENLQAYTGGSNGLTGLPRLPIFGEPFSLNTYYYIVLFISIMVYLITRWLINSKFGRVIKSIRENEDRTLFFGYDANNYKIFIFGLSGMLSGLAGMLYVSMTGFISPTDVGFGLSTMLVLWVAIGGRGTLLGAVIGTLLINWLSNGLSESYPDIWQLFLGLIMILVVLFLPDGIYGALIKRSGKKTFKFFGQRKDTTI